MYCVFISVLSAETKNRCVSVTFDDPCISTGRASPLLPMLHRMCCITCHINATHAWYIIS